MKKRYAVIFILSVIILSTFVMAGRYKHRVSKISEITPLNIDHPLDEIFANVGGTVFTWSEVVNSTLLKNTVAGTSPANYGDINITHGEVASTITVGDKTLQEYINDGYFFTGCTGGKISGSNWNTDTACTVNYACGKSTCSRTGASTTTKRCLNKVISTVSTISCR